MWNLNETERNENILIDTKNIQVVARREEVGGGQNR